MLLVLSTGRLDQIAWRFLRLIALLAFALASGVVIWRIRYAVGMRDGVAEASFWLGGTLAAGAAISSMLAPFAGQKPRMFRVVAGISGLAGIAAATVAVVASLGCILEPPHPTLSPNGGEGFWDALLLGTVHPAAKFLAIASQVLGALLLGSITVAWLLGHAYLTATSMTIAPLRHCSRLLSWAVAVRFAFLLASLTAAWFLARGRNPTLFAQWGGHWLVLLMRVGVGLAPVAVFTYMVANCVRLRATQSATGILYFASAFAYIGELAALRLVVEVGWPL